MSRNAQCRNQPRRQEPVQAGALNLADQERVRQEVEWAVQLAAEQAAHQTFPVYPATSVEAGVATRTRGVPCLVPALRNERLPKDFKGPRKVPNYTADLQPGAWIKSYEMAMELLEVSDAAMAKYFTMMLDGTTRTWLKGLPPNSIGSWAELKARFIQNFKDTCKQPMSIVDLTNCKQEEGESTTHWVRQVKEIIHSSDKMDAGSAVLTLEKNCRFEPLKQKLGRLNCDYNDMGQLMAALIKYDDSDSTKDPVSDEEKTGKGKKNVNGKDHQHNPANQGGNKRKTEEFLANINVQGNNQRSKVDNPLDRAAQVPPLSNY